MRKSLLFCLAAATSLALASPVLAQSDQTQGSQPSTSTSSTSSTSTAKVMGTVVSSSDKQLVIDTPTGRQTFVVASGADIPTGLTAGTQVTVEYQGSGDERTVSRVTTGSSSSTSPYSSSTSPSTSSTSPYSSSSSSSSTTPPRSTTGTSSSGTSGQYSSSGTSTDRDNDMDRHDRRAGATDTDRDHDNLPATASPAFLVGLLGLLSLGGSALLRALRRLL